MKFWDCFLKVLITQGVAALIIIASILILKFGFGNTYKQFLSWYSENVLVDTDINEVIG